MVSFSLGGMAFEYDDNKNQINIKKHGISFKSAARIFFDYDRIEFYDEDHSDDEDRYNTIGDTSAGRISQKAEGALIGNIDQFIGKVNEILFVVYIKYSKDKKRLSEFLTDNPRMLIEANAARVIKAVTNTPLDIPEGAEVIDVCKAVEEMMNESEERGELRMLVQLVRDGDLKLERAAEKAKMTVEQFEKVMENTPLQAV